MIDSFAQLNPMGGVYYENQYILNPGMAGSERGLRINLAYRKQWDAIPGSPRNQSLTLDYGFDKVGLGLSVYNDNAGLLSQTKVMGTYAFHLPLNDENQKLSFGISLGFMGERIDIQNIKGDQVDNKVARFNERDVFIDGDFGIAYTDKKLTLQGAIPNVKTFLKRDQNYNTADRSVFYSAISYKLNLNEVNDKFSFEPKVIFRGVKGFNNIFDVGTNLLMANESLHLMAMYHSSKSATFGLGVDFKKTLSIMGIYTTSAAALSPYTNGDFEVNLKINCFK